MNVKRLKKLARLLFADAAKPKGVKFDLTAWAKKGGRIKAFKNEKRVPVSCGTNACAVGLACISGAFKKEGLSFEIRNKILIPTFAASNNWEAVEIFFEITRDEARFLFESTAYRKSKGAEAEIMVANRILDFADEKVQPGHKIY